MKSEKENDADNNSGVDKSAAEKILRSVPFEQAFHFATGTYTGESAFNLFSFYEELRTIDIQSVKFHFLRRDFQKWVETTLGDQELSQKLDKIPQTVEGEPLRNELLKSVQVRLTQLQTMLNAPTIGKSPEVKAPVTVPAGEFKKYKLEELAAFDGKNGKPTYFAFKGKVYDVSRSSLWQNGDHLGSHQAGKDLTSDIEIAPHGEEVFSKAKQIGILE